MLAITSSNGGLRRLWHAVIYNGVPSGGSDFLGQALIVNIFSLLAVLSLGGVGIEHVLFEHDPRLGWLEVAGSLTIILNLQGLHHTRNLSVARNNLLLIMFALLFVMLVTGGLSGTGIFWFYIFPVSAFFLTGKRTGLIWMTALVAMILAVLLLAQTPLLSTPYTPLTIRQLLVTLVIVAVGIYAYQYSREALAKETEVSEQHSKEEKIRASMVIENIDEGIVAVDELGQVALVNEAVEDLLGIKRAELLGKRFVEVVPMLDGNGRAWKIEDRPLERVLHDHHPVTLGANYQRKNDGLFPVAVTARPILVHGKIRGAIGTFRDITADQAIDHAKSEFVTLASHQLRTPISAIAWISELLLNGDAGRLMNNEQRDYLKQIYDSNTRMAALVDDMLTVSSLELGSLPIRPESLDLAKLSHQVLETQRAAQAADKNFHISEQYDPKLAKLSYDPEICKTILQHLITNALKYTSADGHIAITIRKTNESAPSSSTGNVLIEVADTGVGIPRKQQSKIFTKLFRADNIKHKDTDGTGLGLYIVKTMTEYVGGRISFKSTEGKGSTFSVVLPAAMQARLKGPGLSATSKPVPDKKRRT